MKRINGIYLEKNFEFEVDLSGHTNEHDVGVVVDVMISFLYNETYIVVNGIATSDYILY